jgi:hypothetical protein
VALLNQAGVHVGLTADRRPVARLVEERDAVRLLFGKGAFILVERERRGISWAEWKADMLNRLFAENGAAGEPGRITAATVAHGERAYEAARVLARSQTLTPSEKMRQNASLRILEGK